MPVVKWVFSDPIELDSWTFEINPNAGGSPQYKKNFTFSSPAAPDGSTIMMQGRSDPLTLEFTGVILSESQYKTMVDWWYRQCVIQITDDLLRQYYVVFTDFSPKRERAIHYPWKHSYSAKCTIVGNGIIT